MVRRLSILAPFLWLLVFFLAPFAIVAGISLAEPVSGRPPYTPVFVIANGWPQFQGNLEQYVHALSESRYVRGFLGSLRIATVSTILCLLIAYPMAYAIARARESVRPLLLMAVVLPFWTSFLIRIYAWIGLLRDNGIINHTLISLGLLQEPWRVMNTDTAVFIGVVYAYLPFMILPLYSTLERIDWRLLDAAADLGARPFRSFLSVTLPLSLPGIVAGSLLVFIPVTGEFVIPDLLGGSNTQMIGKILWEEFFQNHNWPSASALAVLMVGVLLPAMIILQRAQRLDEEGG